MGNSALANPAIESIARMAAGSVYEWRDALMVMLQTAFDVSQDQPYRRFLVMAGFVSSAERWNDFDALWRDRLRLDNLQYFQMRAFAQCDTPFHQGWKHNEPRRRKLISELLGIITAHAYQKFAVVVQAEAVNAVSEQVLRHLGRTSLAAAGFHMVGLVDNWRERERYQYAPEYLFEDGDSDKGTLMKLMHEITGKDPIFRAKKDKPEKGILAFTPLQAADLLAYEVKRVADDYGRPLPDNFRFRFPYQELDHMPGEPKVFNGESAEIANILGRIDEYFSDHPLLGPVQ